MSFRVSVIFLFLIRDCDSFLFCLETMKMVHSCYLPWTCFVAVEFHMYIASQIRV